MPRSILVPVDFGDASARAVAVAGALAARCGATMVLLHAETLQAPVYFTLEQIASLESQRRATRKQAERYILQFGEANTSHPFTSLVDERPPVAAILHAATSADLVVMGTHGWQGPKRWWLGSVAERVLRHLGRPLLVVRATAPDVSLAKPVVHAAAPQTGEGALALASAIATCFGGEAIDARFAPIEPVITSASAAVVVAAMPDPPTAAWLALQGEPLLRQSRVPVLFVPESART